MYGFKKMDRDDRILAYLQEKIAPEERAIFEDEMASDTLLAAEVKLMRSVSSELEKGPKLPDPDAVWDQLSAAISEPAQPANDNRQPWWQLVKYAAVASVAIATWQVVAVPRLINEPVPERFRTASEPSDLFTLQVKFVDIATIADVTALLAPLNATISDGPSALGIIRISFADAISRQDALDVLRAHPDLVELALEQ
jgi:hypothetical protein